MRLSPFGLLLSRCGLTVSEAAEWLQVPRNTAEAWSMGRRKPSGNAVNALRELYRVIEVHAVSGEPLPDDCPHGAHQAVYGIRLARGLSEL